MALTDYTEIPDGAPYPESGEPVREGSTVFRFRFFLQGRKYGRQVVRHLQDEAIYGYDYEVGAEIAQFDANQAGTIVEFRAATYGPPRVPGGKLTVECLTSWESVVPRGSWPGGTFDWDAWRSAYEVDEALELGNTKAESVKVHEPQPPIGRKAVEHTLTRPPQLGTELFLGAGESVGIDTPDGGRVLVWAVPEGTSQVSTPGWVSLTPGEQYRVRDADGAEVTVTAILAS